MTLQRWVRMVSPVLPVRRRMGHPGPDLPDVSIKRQELASDQMRYSYSVDVDSCVNFLMFYDKKAALRLWHKSDFVDWENVFLLHPTGTAWRLSFSESGSEIFGSGTLAPDAPRQSEVGQAEPGFWRLGVDYLYALQFQTTTKSETTSEPHVQEISGHLAVTRLASGVAGSAVIRFTLLGPTVNSAVSEARLLNAIEKPFYMAIDRSGAIQRIWFSPELSDAAEGLLRGLASELQFVRSDDNQDTWTAVEEDAGGSYEAIYQCMARNKYQKRKQKYSSSASAGNDLRSIEKSRQSEFELDDYGQLESLSSESIQQVELPGNICLTISNRFRAVMIDSRPACQPFRLPDQRYQGSPLVRVSPKAAIQNTDDAVAQGGQSYDELVSALKEACEEDSDGRAVSRIGVQLVQLFRHEPHEVARLVEDVYTIDEEIAVIMIASAAAADCSASETTLCTLAENKGVPKFARIAAIHGIARQSAPTDRGLDLLSKLADSVDSKDSRVSRTAILFLGSAANRLQKHADGKRLTVNLINRFDDANDRADRMLVLAALGNTGSDQILSVIEAALANDDWRIRAFAVSALRLVPDGRADELIAASVTNDSDSEVRRSALMATGYRNPAAHLDSLFTVLRNDSNTAVRTSALRLAQDWLNANVPVGELIRWTADHDCDPEIRNRAQRSLLSVNLV